MNESETGFIEEAPKSFIVSLGLKRSGKTFLMLQYLKYALTNDIFEEYHLVLPQYGHERDGAYQFLAQFKKNVFIYDAYHSLLAKKVLELIPKKHIMFVIDDATGEFTSGGFDSHMSKLLTVNEHGKTCCVWFCIHGTRKVLPPLARAMLNFLIVYTNDDGLALKAIWEDRFSRLYPRFQDFVEMYDKAMSRDHNAIVYALNRHHELDGIVDWDLLKMKFPQFDKSPKGKIKVKSFDSQKEKMKEQVQHSIEKHQMRAELQPKPNPVKDMSFLAKAFKVK